MKVKDLLHTYKNKLVKLEKIAEDYYNSHYCGYMGEWVAGGTEEDWKKLKQDIIDYLDSEIKL